jgi:hypothetical protein
VVVWSEDGHKGLWIEGAWFWRKKPFTGATVIQVLGRAGLSDIFVPYHMSSFRPFDLHWGELHGAIPQDAGDCGAITDPLVPSPIAGNPQRRVLIKEIRDRGVAWTSDRQTRRGEEMLLWATYDTGNYEYLMQYGFRDDGTVTFRLGSTGYNGPGLPFEPHMHNALWYVDINLAGAAHNSVMLMKHSEPTGSWTATDSMVPFNNGVEGFADWNDKEFTELNISNTLVKNSQGHNISYDLMPMRTGTARHAEDFSHHDFWVTQMNSNELDYNYGFEGWAGVPYINQPQGPQSIMDTDVAVWYISSNHHLPRDEDHEYVQPIRLPGVALTMWSGFDLHPRNLFNDTPLHQPTCAPVPANLVAWWPLDDAFGSTTVADIDATGAAVPTLYGTPQPGALGVSGPTPVPGAVSGALSFDGLNSSVQIPNSPALNFGSGNFSIDAWISTSQNTGVRTVIDKRVQAGSNYQGYSLFTSAGKLGIQLADGPHFMNYGSSGANANIADGNWHHVAVTVNRTGANPEIKWYVDGIPVGIPTSLVGSPVTGSLTNSSPLRLGVRSISFSGYWKGILDELELFNSVLAENEVFAIFAAGRAGKCR